MVFLFSEQIMLLLLGFQSWIKTPDINTSQCLLHLLSFTADSNWKGASE